MFSSMEHDSKKQKSWTNSLSSCEARAQPSTALLDLGDEANWTKLRQAVSSFPAWRCRRKNRLGNNPAVHENNVTAL